MFEDNVELQLAKLKDMDENFRKRGEWRYPERAAIRRAVGTIKVLLNQVYNLTEQVKRYGEIIDDLEKRNEELEWNLGNPSYTPPEEEELFDKHIGGQDGL